MPTKDLSAHQFFSYCLGVFVCGVAVRGAYPHASLFIESAIYFGLLAGLVFNEPTRAVWREAPRLFRYLSAVLMGALLIGQLADAPARTYPFVNWTMYSKQTPAMPRYSQFIAVLEDGSRVPMPYGDIPTPVRPFALRLQQLAWRARANDEAGLSAQRVLVQTLQVLARQRRAGHGPRIREVVLERCEVALSDYHGPDLISCAAVQRFPL